MFKIIINIINSFTEFDINPVLELSLTLWFMFNWIIEAF